MAWEVEEEHFLVRAMEEYEDNLRRSRTIIEITDCQHVFRHVSEWDPRKSKLIKHPDIANI